MRKDLIGRLIVGSHWKLDLWIWKIQINTVTGFLFRLRFVSHFGLGSQEDSNDKSKKANGRPKNFNNQDSNKEGGISCVRQGGAGTNLPNAKSTYFLISLLKSMIWIDRGPAYLSATARKKYSSASEGIELGLLDW